MGGDAVEGKGKGMEGDGGVDRGREVEGKEKGKTGGREV